MKYTDAYKLTDQTLRDIKAHSVEAVQVILMIMAHESGRGKYRRQLKADRPALGLTQIERPTFDTVVKYGDRFAAYCERAGYDPDAVRFEDLETDDRLCIVLTRARLAMDSEPLPKTPVEQAEFCKRFWNGPGKATANKYLEDWEKWQLGL